jgi:hypothetical protein
VRGSLGSFTGERNSLLMIMIQENALAAYLYSVFSGVDGEGEGEL